MNPYKILNIDHYASKREIIQAAAQALRERKFSSREVAVAQKELLDPITKAAHAFLNFIDVKPLQERLTLTRPEVRSVSDLKRLSIFDETS
ncbi:MAG: hypothetical protein JRG73_18875 [Deltaproteobacteria bacterium]|nr:hypothetical protein [Deltaproteobacteria bacterium]MBW2308991.1 hypothetical protein [Deltaproteobacteria bacterium]